MNAIEISGLRKAFRSLRGSTTALDGLDLEVPSGQVFGFLGPNGSGKTTTIRCLMGLVGADKGTVRVLGEPVSELHRVIHRMGAVVETPTLFGGYPGRRNLEILADIGGVPKGRIDDVLERVGLSDRAGDLVKSYSLGMKQRLSLAGVLLKDPELLVLDEPGNGLDPAGLREIRDLLRSLAAEGRTVFLSSHLLGEVQMICDRVGIVRRGRCIRQGPVSEVLAGGRAETLVVEVREIRKATDVLSDAGYAVHREGDHLLVEAPRKRANRITKALADEGIYLTGLRAAERTLEDAFLELTEEEA